MFRILVLAGFMLAAGVVAVRFVDQTGHAPALAMAAKPAPAPAPEPANSRTMVIKAGAGGHVVSLARALDARARQPGARAVALSRAASLRYVLGAACDRRGH